MIVKLNILHSIELINYFNIIYKRNIKTNIFSEVKKCLTTIMNKDFINDFNIIMNFDSNNISLEANGHVLASLIINIKDTSTNAFHSNTEVKKIKSIFAPIIYYMFPEIQRIGRMIVHKKENNISKYLVHRSNYNNFPLTHPGGHIEYIETSLIDKNLLCGKQYIEAIITNALNRATSDHLNKTFLDVNTFRWILHGTCREIHEESGLDLSSYISQINLIKIGLKIHYFSVSIDSDVNEKGPLVKFKSEIYSDNEYVKTHNVPVKLSDTNYSVINTVSQNDNDQYNQIISFKMSPYCYDDLCHVVNQENIRDTFNLDEFWRIIKNNVTNHAWITCSEMKTYWDKRYLSHIDKIIDATICL